MKWLVKTRLAWATVLLFFPDHLPHLLGERDPDRRWMLLARVLGVRHLIQLWVERTHHRNRVELDAGVDALHAASAVAFGILARRHRRLAWTDAAIAATFAAWGLASYTAGPMSE